MTWARLGPLGGLREIPNPVPETPVEAVRRSSELVTLDGTVYAQRSPRRSRSWRLGHVWQAPELLSYLTACAEGAILGPLYLHTQDAALTNLFPSDVAAPCRMGTSALGSVPGAVSVGIAGRVARASGVAQLSIVGAWTATVPIRQVAHVLSGWASAAGAVIEWRTVTAAGVQVATGAVFADAVAGGFYGAVSIVPGVTVAGIQVRLAAGSRTVGGLRLVEGVQRSDGVEVRRNLATNPVSAVAAMALRQGGTGGTAARSTVWFHRGPASTLLTRGTSYTYVETTPATAHAASGTVVHFGAWVMVPSGNAATSVHVAVRGTVGFSTTTHTLAPGVPAWISRSVTTTAPGQTVGFEVGWEPGLGAPGWLVHISDVQTSTTPINDASGFDGSYSPDSDRLPSWTSTPNASASVLKTIPADAVSDDWLPGVGVPQVVVSDPQQTLQLVTDTETLSDYTITLREVGR